MNHLPSSSVGRTTRTELLAPAFPRTLQPSQPVSQPAVPCLDSMNVFRISVGVLCVGVRGLSCWTMWDVGFRHSILSAPLSSSSSSASALEAAWHGRFFFLYVCNAYTARSIDLPAQPPHTHTPPQQADRRSSSRPFGSRGQRSRKWASGGRSDSRPDSTVRIGTEHAEDHTSGVCTGEAPPPSNCASARFDRGRAAWHQLKAAG